MREDYWTLFRITGDPVFYLLYRHDAEENETARTAWHASQAQLV